MTRLSREDIVIGAGKRFATYGYHGTSMRDLGDDLGILGSSIYAHVGGKQELLLAVIERGARLFEESAANAVSSYDAPTERLRSLIDGHVDVLVDHEAESRTFLNEAAFLDPIDHDRVTAMRDAYELVFRDTIRAGVLSGAFRSDVDPKISGIFVLSMLNATQRWYHPDGALSRADLVQQLHLFAISGLT
jgi:AcrR family transcriptional regulator